jgi:hypothetical protein
LFGSSSKEGFKKNLFVDASGFLPFSLKPKPTSSIPFLNLSFFPSLIANCSVKLQLNPNYALGFEIKE